MPSGLVTFYVRSVAIKGGARVGDFNGEVIVRPSGYRDELARAAARVSEMEKRVTEAEERVVAAEAAARERVAVARADARREALTAMETVAQSLKPQRRSVTVGRVRIAQAGTTTRTPKHVWAVFSVENRDSQALTLEDVRADGFRVALATTGARRIAGRSKGRVAVCVEAEKEAPRQLTFVVNGAHVTVPLAP